MISQPRPRLTRHIHVLYGEQGMRVVFVIPRLFDQSLGVVATAWRVVRKQTGKTFVALLRGSDSLPKARRLRRRHPKA
jgi:hypothetical protein